MKGIKKHLLFHLIILWAVGAIFLTACHPGMMDNLFAPRLKDEFGYDCSPGRMILRDMS
jgi:hypothetical protein